MTTLIIEDGSAAIADSDVGKMIQKYLKGYPKKISKHFSSEEFACPCESCQSYVVDDDLVALLETLRAHFGKPVHINSGYRCYEHNKAIGGVDRSQHRLGKAADIHVAGVSPKEVQVVADRLNPNGGVGSYASFTHIDTRAEKARWRG